MKSDFDGAFHNQAPLTGYSGSLRSLAWRADGGQVLAALEDGKVAMWDDIDSPDGDSNRKVPYIKQVSSSGVTGISWSPQKKLWAFCTTGGNVHFCDAISLRELHVEIVSKDPLTKIAWEPQGATLASADDVGRVFILDFDARPGRIARQVAIGHVSGVRSLAWDTNSSYLYSGTELGTIGAWRESAADNQLREFLQGANGEAVPFEHAVVDLAVSSSGTIAGLSSDGTLKFWSAPGGQRDRECMGQILFEDPGSGLDFSPDGRILVARTLRRLHFVDWENKLEVHSRRLPSSGDFRPELFGANRASQRIATENRQAARIEILWIDYKTFNDRSRTEKRSYRRARVVLLGAPGIEAFSLAETCSVAQSDFRHDAAMHLISHNDVPAEPGQSPETHDVILCDLTNNPDLALMYSIGLFDADIAWVAFDWASLAERHSDVLGLRVLARRTKSILLVGANADHKTIRDLEFEGELRDGFWGAQNIYDLKQNGVGKDLLCQVTHASVDWPALAQINSTHLFQAIRTFVNRTRSLFETEESLYSRFTHQHPSLESSCSQETFKSALGLLEIFHEIQRFTPGEIVLLKPVYFESYAAAIIGLAQRDSSGMGRANFKQIDAPDLLPITADRRLRPAHQERFLINLIVHQLQEKQIARQVHADGTDFLIFPPLVSRTSPKTPPARDVAVKAIFSHGGMLAYQALITRLLTLQAFYCNPQLYVNAAELTATSGGVCGLLCDEKEGSNVATIGAYFSGDATEITQQAFLKFLEEYTKENGGVWERNTNYVQPRSEPEPPPSRHVYICFDYDDISDIEKIEQEMATRGVVAWTGSGQPGVSRDIERRQARMQHDIVIVALRNQKPRKQLLRDITYFTTCTTAIIPVILAGGAADRQVNLPGELKRLKLNRVDLRQGRWSTQMKDLADAILVAKPTRPIPSAPPLPRRPHLFLSYCRDDINTVIRLVAELRSEGFAVWWDQDRLKTGDAWWDEVRAAVGRSYAFVACFSQSVMDRKSSELWPELDEAVTINRSRGPRTGYLIPALLSDVKVPLRDVGSGRSLDKLEVVKLFDPHWQQGIGRLCDRLRLERRKPAGLKPRRSSSTAAGSAP